ncbi:hypothetical protein [Mariprofundus micogutta]|uniref:hypothetical protein n=1 Tax=Mariprofundus micogutta TaxID=1921010 RepID=UPI001D1069BB|nr:hypothetical protein [Mariprofundus micogutta]
MKKSLFAMTIAVMFALAAPVTTTEHVSFGYQKAQAAEAVDGMKRLKLIIRKLRDAMGSMKDFDELEKAGLSKKDVNRMRRAMEDKINQMMEDAIYAIRNI